jgi:hypothetical protein
LEKVIVNTTTAKNSTEHVRAWRLRNPDKRRKSARDSALKAYNKNPEKFRAKTAQWRIDNPAKALIVAARASAKRAGRVFEITAEDLLPLPEFCPVLGLKLVYGATGGRKHSTASIDRIDNSRGYVRGNVAVISWQANELKRNATVAQLEAIIRYMKTGDH